MGVLNVVTMAKNLIIGIIVAVYMLASRKRFVQQAKLVLYSIFKPRWVGADQGRSGTPIRCSAASSTADHGFRHHRRAVLYGCLIFKFPSALLVSVIIGVTNVIPFFRPVHRCRAPPPC